jgi:hypothetical protein
MHARVSVHTHTHTYTLMHILTQKEVILCLWSVPRGAQLGEHVCQGAVWVELVIYDGSKRGAHETWALIKHLCGHIVCACTCMSVLYTHLDGIQLYNTTISTRSTRGQVCAWVLRLHLRYR